MRKLFVLGLTCLLLGLGCLHYANAQIPLLGAGGKFKQAAPQPTVMQAITDAGLTTNLKLVLDAGDASSYTSGTKWLDVSGNGYDFFLGSDGTTDAPTFTGSAGTRSSYFNAGANNKYFTYDTTNEAWMETLHKDGAIFSSLVAIYPAFGTTNGFWGTSSSTDSNIGARHVAGGSTGGQVISSFNGTGVPALNAGGATTGTNAWKIYGVSLSENGGNVSFLVQNGAYDQVSASDTFDAAYSSPSSSSATYTMQIGAVGNAATSLRSGSRVGFIAIWQGTALTKGNMDTLYAALKGRYGL